MRTKESSKQRRSREQRGTKRSKLKKLLPTKREEEMAMLMPKIESTVKLDGAKELSQTNLHLKNQEVRSLQDSVRVS